jgi:hypothetical protein
MSNGCGANDPKDRDGLIDAREIERTPQSFCRVWFDWAVFNRDGKPRAILACSHPHARRRGYQSTAP